VRRRIGNLKLEISDIRERGVVFGACKRRWTCGHRAPLNWKLPRAGRESVLRDVIGRVGEHAIHGAETAHDTTPSVVVGIGTKQFGVRFDDDP